MGRFSIDMYTLSDIFGLSHRLHIGKEKSIIGSYIIVDNGNFSSDIKDLHERNWYK